MTTLQITTPICNGLLPLLPRKLRQLEANLVEINADTFRMLPPTLRVVDMDSNSPEMYANTARSNWDWRDLRLLPPNNLGYLNVPESNYPPEKANDTPNISRTQLFARAS